jgi:hypothetical protein
LLNKPAQRVERRTEPPIQETVMANVVSLTEARTTYRHVDKPIRENLGDGHAPMRGILIGAGASAVMWIAFWVVVL